MNLAPVTGNVLVMSWNAFCSMLSLPFAAHFSQMFVTGTFFASLAGLLTGIPLFPGVIESEDTRSIVALIGIALFLLAFEVAMASSFFVLAQILFPEDSPRPLA